MFVLKSNPIWLTGQKKNPTSRSRPEPKKRAIPQNAICHAPGTHPLHPSREMPCSLHSRKTLALASALKQWGTTTDGNSTNQQHPCPSGPWRCGSVYSRQWDGPSGIKAGPGSNFRTLTTPHTSFPGGSPCDPTRSIPTSLLILRRHAATFTAYHPPSLLPHSACAIIGVFAEGAVVIGSAGPATHASHPVFCASNGSVRPRGRGDAEEWQIDADGRLPYIVVRNGGPPA